MAVERHWMIATLEDLECVARRLAETLMAQDVLCLKGPLGVGKTALARALIQTLSGVSTLPVPSPSFTLLQIYDTALGSVWHFDLFRLKRWEEILELGWDEALCQGVMMIEWPDIVAGRLPPDRLEIALRFFQAPETYPQGRWVSMVGFGSWRERLETLVL